MRKRYVFILSLLNTVAVNPSHLQQPDLYHAVAHFNDKLFEFIGIEELALVKPVQSLKTHPLQTDVVLNLSHSKILILILVW